MATAAVVAVRRRHEAEQAAGGGPASPLLADDRTVRRLVGVQALFRGHRWRRLAPAARHLASGDGKIKMVPVRTAEGGAAIKRPSPERAQMHIRSQLLSSMSR